MNEYFTEVLALWGKENRRDLPWVGIKDPYRIWLSEIMLQQTRVEQGLPYYQRFTEAFPTVFDLAAAPDDEVMKLWEGLGYYSRARNLLKAAKMVVAEHQGVFPESREGLRALPGIGEYTSGAIASFAFDLPEAVVDGNVYRVLSRFFGIDDPIDSTTGKKRFAELARAVLNEKESAAHNQAIMDFGSRQCSPRNPDCEGCPLSPRCRARAAGRVEELPVKSRKQAKRDRWFYYMVLRMDEQVLVRQRTAKDIWQGLYDFPAVESDKALSEKEVFESVAFKSMMEGVDYSVTLWSPEIRQVLSHQNVRGVFLEIRCEGALGLAEAAPVGDLRWVSEQVIPNLAFPRLIRRYWEEPVLS